MSNSSTTIAVAQAPSLVKDYYELTKPGITQMVALTTLTGYYLAIPTNVVTYASQPHNWLHFAATIVGTVLISSGSCVLNHVLEKDSDALMKRTATRPLPSGTISVRSATVYGLLLSVLGASLLAFTNVLTVLLAIATWVTYVLIYTPAKQRTTLSLLIGGIPGALPFAGGVTAVSGSFDGTAWVVFAILFFWQLPHFLALSWMYRTDYKDGGYVMHAVENGSARTVGLQMVVYGALLLVSLLLVTVLGIAGTVYTIGSTLLGIWLLVESIRFVRQSSVPSARRVLLTSYAVLMGVLVLMVIDKLPV